MSDAKTEIKKVWRIVAVGKDSVIELRALWPKGVSGPRPPQTKHFRAADYPDIDAVKSDFETTALSLNASGYNIYTVMNPIRSDFTGPGAAKDIDITSRNLLLIDIDRVGDTSVPANQGELDAAKSLASDIMTAMMVRGWPQPITVMSGNGYHLYFRLGNLPNDGSVTALVRQTLAALAATFNNAIVGVDTSVFNAARITKVPGTIMRKGIATADRPYRMAEVCDE